jgi:hypothetical protein
MTFVIWGIRVEGRRAAELQEGHLLLTMKPFSLLLLVVSPLFIVVNAWPNIRDAPSTTVDIQDGQTGTLMVLPPRQTDTGTKRVPGMPTNRQFKLFGAHNVYPRC